MALVRWTQKDSVLLKWCCIPFMYYNLTLFGSVKAKASSSPKRVICTTVLSMMPLTRVQTPQLELSYELETRTALLCMCVGVSRANGFFPLPLTQNKALLVMLRVKPVCFTRTITTVFSVMHNWYSVTCKTVFPDLKWEKHEAIVQTEGPLCGGCDFNTWFKQYSKNHWQKIFIEHSYKNNCFLSIFLNYMTKFKWRMFVSHFSDCRSAAEYIYIILKILIIVK